MSGLEKELESVARNVSSLSKSGDEFAEQEVFIFIFWFSLFSIFKFLLGPDCGPDLHNETKVNNSIHCLE